MVVIYIALITVITFVTGMIFGYLYAMQDAAEAFRMLGQEYRGDPK